MDQLPNHTALLLFSRTSASEAGEKSFLPNKSSKQNKKIAEQLIKRSVQNIKATTLPYFIINEHKQVGNSFGEKLGNAIQFVFDQGYKKVVVTGNDCLSLSRDLIEKAAASLQTTDMVISPTEKGGASLIGLTQTTFNQNHFQSIRWQTQFTFHDLLALHQPSAICQLPLLDDINDFTDLKKQVPHLSKNDSFRCFAEGIITSAKQVFAIFSNPFTRSVPHNLFGLKAPPASSFS